MEVIKRDGSTEPVKLDKITARIKKQTWDLNIDYVDYMEVVKKTISGLHDGITTTELDNLAAETAAGMASTHPDYSLLASRIAITFAGIWWLVFSIFSFSRMKIDETKPEYNEKINYETIQ